MKKSTEKFLEELVRDGEVTYSAPTDGNSDNDDNEVSVRWFIADGKIKCRCQSGKLDLSPPDSLERAAKIYEDCLASLNCGNCLLLIRNQLAKPIHPWI